MLTYAFSPARSGSKGVPDIWMRLKPTNPFRSVASVRQAIEVLATNASVETVRIVSKGDPRLVVTNTDGFLEPLLTDIWDPARSASLRLADALHNLCQGGE